MEGFPSKIIELILGDFELVMKKLEGSNRGQVHIESRQIVNDVFFVLCIERMT